MDARQFKILIVRPVLQHIGLRGEAAVNLVTGTAAVESNFDYVRQLPNGPALSFFQMEPNTHDDIWRNYLIYKKDLASKILQLKVIGFSDEQNMMMNNAYATAMCRVHYLRMPEKLPEHDDAIALARYHKQWYNTPLGKTQLEKSIPLFKAVIQL